MNVSRPEAEDEYSSRDRAWQRRFERHRGLVLVLALAGAALLLSAELTPLLHVRTVAAHPRTVRTVTTGHHDRWALLPIAVAVVLISVWAWRTGSRLALAAVALLGAAALVIALARDLPAVHVTGLLGSPATGLSEAQSRPAIGVYLETLGAALVLVSAAAGVLLEPTTVARVRRRRAAEKRETRGLPTARDRGLR